MLGNKLHSGYSGNSKSHGVSLTITPAGDFGSGGQPERHCTVSAISNFVAQVPAAEPLDLYINSMGGPCRVPAICGRNRQSQSAIPRAIWLRIRMKSVGSVPIWHRRFKKRRQVGYQKGTVRRTLYTRTRMTTRLSIDKDTVLQNIKRSNENSDGLLLKKGSVTGRSTFRGEAQSYFEARC